MCPIAHFISDLLLFLEICRIFVLIKYDHLNINMSIIDNILSDSRLNSKEICKAIAEKVKARRLDLDMTQEGICKRAGVNISSYRRFERTGLISLEGLVKISFVLEMEKDFDKLFTQRIYQSIDDVIEANFTERKRGKNNG